MRTNGKAQRKSKGKPPKSKHLDGGLLHQKIDGFLKEWAEKYNDLSERFSRVVESVGKQFGIIEGNTKIHADCIQHLDIQQAVTSKVIQDVYHRLQVLEHIQRAGEETPVSNPEELRRQANEIFTQVVETSFHAVREEKVAEQNEKLEEVLQAQREGEKASMELAAQEAEAALESDEETEEEEEEVEEEETDEEEETEEEEDDEDEDEDDVEESSADEEVAKKEAEIAANALRSAEIPELVAEGPGGPGSDIPEKAEVFGS